MKNKIQLSLLALFLFLTSASFAGAGFFGSGTGAALAYTQNGGSMTTTTSFGNNIGSTTSLELNGAYIHTWKDGSGNICNGTLNYRIYPSAGAASGSFTQVSLGFSANHSFTTTATPSNVNSGGTGDQPWGQTSATTNLLASLTTGTQYVLEFYFEASGSTSNSTGCTDNLFYSNGGSNYTITCTVAAPVPVRLIDFYGNVSSDGVQLDWSTASELNASHFGVYRSLDAIEKVWIGSVTANGTTSEIKKYSFVDEEAKGERVFYFLEQVDFDGATEWYGPVRVDINETASVRAFFTASGALQIKGDISTYQCAKVVSLDGRIIAETTLTSGSQQLSMPSLPKGIYFLELKNSESTKLISLLR